MTFAGHISQHGSLWIGEHTSKNVGPIRVTGSTRQEAIEKLVGEIRHWLELCPCTGQTYQDIEVELVEA